MTFIKESVIQDALQLCHTLVSFSRGKFTLRSIKIYIHVSIVDGQSQTRQGSYRLSRLLRNLRFLELLPGQSLDPLRRFQIVVGTNLLESSVNCVYDYPITCEKYEDFFTISNIGLGRLTGVKDGLQLDLEVLICRR